MHLLQRYLSDFLNLIFPTEGEPEYLWPWKEFVFVILVMGSVCWVLTTL